MFEDIMNDNLVGCLLQTKTSISEKTEADVTVLWHKKKYCSNIENHWINNNPKWFNFIDTVTYYERKGMVFDDTTLWFFKTKLHALSMCLWVTSIEKTTIFRNDLRSVRIFQLQMKKHDKSMPLYAMGITKIYWILQKYFISYCTTCYFKECYIKRWYYLMSEKRNITV